MEPSTQATCYRHPDRVTGLACTECGRPICSACSVDAAVGQRCPACVAAAGTQRTIDARQALSSRLRERAPVTSGVIGITVGIFVVGMLSQAIRGDFVQWFSMANFLIAEGEWYRMFSVTLVHANLTHILFNMWALYNLGPQIERELGGVRFMALYLSTAAAGSAFAFHLGDISDVGVGASGAIFGLFGVWMASAVRRRNTRYGRAILNQLGFLLLINAAIPLFIPSVSWQAHLGGLLAGFGVGWLWGSIKGANAYAQHLVVAVAVAVAAVVSIPLSL